MARPAAPRGSRCPSRSTGSRRTIIRRRASRSSACWTRAARPAPPAPRGDRGGSPMSSSAGAVDLACRPARPPSGRMKVSARESGRPSRWRDRPPILLRGRRARPRRRPAPVWSMASWIRSSRSVNPRAAARPGWPRPSAAGRSHPASTESTIKLNDTAKSLVRTPSFTAAAWVGRRTNVADPADVSM